MGGRIVFRIRSLIPENNLYKDETSFCRFQQKMNAVCMHWVYE